MTVWLNGRLVEKASIDCFDRGFTLGDGLFETLRVEGGAARHWDRHWSRFSHGAKVLGISVGCGPAVFQRAIADLAQANGLADGVARLTVSRGVGARGLLPPADPTLTMVLTMAPLSPPLGPARLTVCESTRRNQFSPLSGIKSLNYLDGILARQEAAAKGFDDALLLNTVGLAVETTVSSLFAAVKGELVTPPVGDGALPGVARGLVLDRLGARQRSLTVDDLYQADEIVVTNVLGCRQVVEIDGKIIPVGKKIVEIQSAIERP